MSGNRVHAPIKAVTCTKDFFTILPLLLLYISMVSSQQIVAAIIEESVKIFIGMVVIYDYCYGALLISLFLFEKVKLLDQSFLAWLI